MKSVSYQLSTTNDKLTSRAGLSCVAQVIQGINLSDVVDHHFPVPGSNRGYRASTYVHTFMLMLHEGGRCLEDVRHLRSESSLLSVLGFKSLPSSDALGDWLRRMGRGKAGLNALDKVNRVLLKAALGSCREVTLDIDATAILCGKRDARYTYLKEKGYMPMVGHIEQTGQIVSMQFRRGHVPPAKDNFGFIKQCEAALPEDVKVNRLRIDAAGYQHAIIDDAIDRGIGFAIRAKLSASCRRQILSLPESRWRPWVHRDGRLSSHQQTCRIVHTMQDSRHPFTLVLQRTIKSGQQSIPLQDHDATESIEHGGYLYRAIATNRDQLSDSEIIHWYNQRAEHSENRIKELKADFAGAALPCGEFKANELYFALCGLAYNLFVLMKAFLPPQWMSARVTTVRWRLYAFAAKIVRHGRVWWIKLPPIHRHVLDQALLSLRRLALSP